MSKDHKLHDELLPVCERYIRQAADPVWFCQQLITRLQELEQVAKRNRTPAMGFTAETVSKLLKGEEP